MKAEYKRDLQNNYLILEVEKEQAEKNYGLLMAERNEISGLLKFHCSRKDGKLYLHYEITSKQTMENIYEKKLLGYQDILNILTDVRDILEQMQKYLLDPAQLLFNPQYVFMGPERRIALCYFPDAEKEDGIIALAEYILKRLNHEDIQAVTLGYRFYQNVCEENFSLNRIWKELFAVSEERSAGRNASFEDKYGNSEDNPYEDAMNRKEDLFQDRNVQDRGTKKKNSAPYSDVEYAAQMEPQESYEVIHKVRRKKGKKKKTDWIFERVHPAVLLSSLFFLAVIEILLYFGIIHITEAGGLFFLMISVEILINKYWRQRKSGKKKQEREGSEEAEKEYRQLQEELYRNGMSQREQYLNDVSQRELFQKNFDQREPYQKQFYQENSEADEIEETRCLVPADEKDGIRMLYVSGGTEAGLYPDICIEEEILYVGKRKGESDIILDSPTVSRMHARLEGRNGTYYVKDLNSRNGTYCNDEKLHPQEEREIQVGDRVSFAEIEYRVVSR